ncbi:MAG: amidase family protein [Pseudomonadota bacterium]
MASDADLVNQSAIEVLALLRSGDVSPLDLLDALEVRIAQVDDKVHALPTLCFDRARAAAKTLMQKPLEQRGVLCGLPVPIKDLDDVAGVRTTYGSTIFSDHIPDQSSDLVVQIESEGGLVYAKSNTPEFGSGAHTFNEVFPTTVNPHNAAMSAGGSSGGAAVALATGTAWVAQGSDMAGSLRTPASFCGVVGMRPSPGRIVSGPGSANPFDVLSSGGAMARSVADLALLFDAMSGAPGGDPLAQSSHASGYRARATQASKPARVAFSLDLGITPVEPEIANIVRSAVSALERDGIEVIEAHPDLRGVHDTFRTLRAHNYAIGMEETLRDHRDKLKADNVWNIEQGLALSGAQIVQAQRERAGLFYRMSEFMRDVDVLICPTAIVPSFPIDARYVESCNGHSFAHYFEWLAIVYAITTVAHPAISLPCGVANNGVPVGLQVVGKAQGDADLISNAAYIERLLGIDAKPVDPVT